VAAAAGREQHSLKFNLCPISGQAPCNNGLVKNNYQPMVKAFAQIKQGSRDKI